MNIDFVSVIVPVYNADRYIDDCIKSILAQTYPYFEIICVNDGSTDKSLSLLKKYRQQDSRVRIFNKTNSGVSSSRNLGIKKARGNLVSFVDADDILHPQFLECMVSTLQRSQTDVVCCRYSIFQKKQADIHKFNTQYSYRCNKHTLISYLLHLTEYNYMAWGKIYHKKSIQSIWFHEKIQYGEDALFFLTLLLKSRKFSFVPLNLYFYRESLNSLTRAPFNSKKIADAISSFLICQELANIHKISFISKLLFLRKIHKRCFRSCCLTPYRQDPKNANTWWEQFIPTVSQLVSDGKFNPKYLGIRHQILFYLWRTHRFKWLRCLL